MSKHLSRKDRWQQTSAARYVSELGSVVHEKQGWFGLLDYRLQHPEATPQPVWEAHQQRIGPFKRPRNAMVDLEREAAMLKNRHGDRILFGTQLWAEA